MELYEPKGFVNMVLCRLKQHRGKPLATSAQNFFFIIAFARKKTQTRPEFCSLRQRGTDSKTYLRGQCQIPHRAIHICGLQWFAEDC